MSPQLPSLTSWIEAHFAALMVPLAQESDFYSNFQSTFAQNAEFIINHSPIPYETVEKNLIAQLSAATNVTIEWRHITEIPAEEGDNANLAGIVTGVVVITRSLKLRVLGGPMQVQTFDTFSAKIEQDPTAQPDGNGDRRRIVQIFETIHDKAVPVKFQKQGDEV